MKKEARAGHFSHKVALLAKSRQLQISTYVTVMVLGVGGGGLLSAGM